MDRQQLKIDEDIRRASTLHTSIYFDEHLYKISLDRIFARSWQPLELDVLQGDDSNVFPVTLLKGCLDEPLVVTNNSGKWGCYSNVCTHRGNILATHKGKFGQLTCGYHGKCFDLRGKYKSMPEFDQAVDFPSDRDHLPELPLHRLGPLWFTSLDPPLEFGRLFAPLIDRMSWFDFEGLVFVPELSNTYRIDAHWALYCENYLEGFHIPYVHPALNKMLEFSEYSTDVYDYCNLQLGIAREGEVFFDLPEDHQDFGRKILAYYWWVFPNIMLNIYTWGLSLNIVKPQGPQKTEIVFKTYLLPGVEKEGSIADGLDSTEMEDEAIVLDVQMGVKSRLYEQGRFSPTMEKGVHHFQRLLSKFLKS